MRFGSVSLYLLSGVSLVFLLLWSVRNEGKPPDWAIFLCVLPLILARVAARSRRERTESPLLEGAFGLFLLGASLFAMAIGGLALGMRGSGSLIEVLAFMLPAGAGLCALVLIVWWLRARGR